MTEYIRQRPWIWVLVILALFVGVNILLLVVATSSHGPDLMPANQAETTTR